MCQENAVGKSGCKISIGETRERFPQGSREGQEKSAGREKHMGAKTTRESIGEEKKPRVAAECSDTAVQSAECNQEQTRQVLINFS